MKPDAYCEFCPTELSQIVIQDISVKVQNEKTTIYLLIHKCIPKNEQKQLTLSAKHDAVADQGTTTNSLKECLKCGWTVTDSVQPLLGPMQRPGGIQVVN